MISDMILTLVCVCVCVCFFFFFFFFLVCERNCLFFIVLLVENIMQSVDVFSCLFVCLFVFDLWPVKRKC